MKKSLSLVACALLVAGLAACNADKEPAHVAIKAADQEINAAAPEAEKYVPEQLAAARAAHKAAQDQFAKGDYKGARAAATALDAQAKALAPAATAKKEELTKAWNDLAATLPPSVAAIQAKLEELGKAKKLPKGLDAAKVTQAKDGLAGITKSWDEASAAFTAGNLADALAKSGGLKEKCAEVMALLGMAPPASPAEHPADHPAEHPAAPVK